MSIFFRFFNTCQQALFNTALLMIPVLILTGCASLSKSECQQGDWAKIGKKDGSRGYVAKSQLNEHQRACAKYQISPQTNTYYDGYRQGLQQFCRRESGLKFGVKSSKYLGTCPASLEPAFLSGYLSGLEIAMNDIADDIDELRHLRHKLKRRLFLLDHQDVKDNDDRKGKDKDKRKDKSKNKKGKDSYKKFEGKLDDVHSSISSKRSKINKLRSWYARWAK